VTPRRGIPSTGGTVRGPAGPQWPTSRVVFAQGLKKLARKIVLALATLAGGLLVADWVVGRWFPIPASLYRLDPVLIYALAPGARQVRVLPPEAGGSWISTSINRAGYRGRELAPAKQGRRIVVFGDSLVLALGVALQDTFVERLGVNLESAAGIEMVNAGVSGYGPDQECLKLEREIDGLAPDLVVLVLCAHNDFGDLVRDKMFSLDAQDHLVLNEYSLEPKLAAEFETKLRGSHRPALVRALASTSVQQLSSRDERARRSSATRNLPYIEWYLAAGADEYSEFVLEGNLRVRQVFEDYYDADLSIHPEWPSSVFKRRLMKPVLARIQDDCARRGIPLFVLVVPSAMDLCPDFDIHVDPARYPTWSPTRLTDAFAEILSGLGVPFINLHVPFTEAGPERLFLGKNDIHWNAAGQDLAARLTAAFLREHGLWPPSSSR
jgi:lysophospholipase L1-like esterase